MIMDDRLYLLARLQEAEDVIRRLLLCTTYAQFNNHRRLAERTAFTLREILKAQDREVCRKLDNMRLRASASESQSNG